MPEIRVIERTLATTHRWLARLREESALDDSERAYAVLRATLNALRDRVGPDVAVHVAAQLPLLLRGTFYEGWEPKSTPQRLDLDGFLSRVAAEACIEVPAAISAVRAVMQLLDEELAPGTMRHVRAVLPTEFAVVA